MPRFNATISSKGGRKDGDDDVFWQDPHDNWEQTQLPGIACDCCQKLTGAQTVHQMCNDCYITVCRDCVAKGEISNLDSHVPHEVGDFDWVKHLSQPGSGARGQPSMAIAAPGRQANTPSASATKDKSSASKSSSKSSSKKGGKAFGKDSANRMTQNTLTSNQNSSLALSTPTKVKNPSAAQLRPSQAKHSKKNKASKKKKAKKTYYNSDSYSDFVDDDDDDMSAPSDKEYVPPAEVGGKGSAPSAAVATAGRGVAPVGLAQSRPVRATAINTYEKMRSGSVKKEEPEAQDEVKMSEIPEAKKSHASKGKTSRLAYGDSAVEQANIPAQDYGYAQQGQVQGGGAYLHAPQYGEGYRHRGLPQLHPGVAHKAKASPSPSPAHQTQAVQSPASASPAAENKRAATAAEKAPAAKRQNTSKMDSLTAGMSFMSAGTADTPKKIATPQKAKASQKGKAPENVQAPQEIQASQAQSSTQVQAQQQIQIGNPFQIQSQIQVLQQQHVFPPQRIAPNVTPEEREASRRLVTASMVDIMDAIQHKVKLHVRNGGVSAAQRYDSILREVVHKAWVANIVLTLMKRRNGELAAFQLLRGYTNTITVNMNLGQCPLTRNWMDATDQDIQSTAPFVPDIVQINEVQSAVQPSLTFPINGEDVVGANTMMFMSAGGHGN
ncbi:hypothetical protein CSAL01_00004 [Colletotrichum salicis]|uniref:Uncharacterized protein n=1 Tax=Colletotrichum salicis TaxID=1209931 RepID=A0A135UTN2_9PEZI|nr:hypothetical protein CSAL01_00004 [Colletotrichum salicis]